MFHLSWLVWCIGMLAVTQTVIMLVTVYFHRAMAHRAVELSPSVLRLSRFLSWFLLSMDPQEFAAVHRKHHAHCDTQEDPHSPARFGWWGVLTRGLALYQREAANPATMAQYGKGLPVDPWEGFYRRHSNLGILVQGILWIGLLGWQGLLSWGLVLVWIPFWAAGVVNGLGHAFGYRSFDTEDLSTNLSPWGLWIGGEELHNNHHADPSNPRFARAWYELDLGWGVIRLLSALGRQGACVAAFDFSVGRSASASLRLAQGFSAGAHPRRSRSTAGAWFSTLAKTHPSSSILAPTSSDQSP